MKVKTMHVRCLFLTEKLTVPASNAHYWAMQDERDDNKM
jgi:hypothetical protein